MLDVAKAATASLWGPLPVISHTIRFKSLEGWQKNKCFVDSSKYGRLNTEGSNITTALSLFASYGLFVL